MQPWCNLARFWTVLLVPSCSAYGQDDSCICFLAAGLRVCASASPKPKSLEQSTTKLARTVTKCNKPLPSFLITERNAYLWVSESHLDLTSNFLPYEICLILRVQCLVLCVLSQFHCFALEPGIVSLNPEMKPHVGFAVASPSDHLWSVAMCRELSQWGRHFCRLQLRGIGAIAVMVCALELRKAPVLLGHLSVELLR